MAETLILDPSELAGSRTSLDLTPWIASEGVDWGDALIQAHMAEQQVGAVPVDFSIPNRQATIPLVLKTQGGTTFAQARSLIQAKVGLWQQQGGWIKRVLSSGGTVFADVVNANLRLGGGWSQAHKDFDTEAAITLECIPDFYEAEEDLGDNTETTAAELIFTETTSNGGDFPSGDRVRIVVDDDSGQNQRGLIWHFRGRHFSSATTAASEYEAEELQPLDTATKVAKVGASGGTVVTHGTLSTSWTPVVGTNIAGTSYLTHTGTNRIYARVFSTSGTAVEARFVYDVGDLVLPVENPSKTLYDGGTFHILDLGEARLDPPPSGTHRWQGMIQARGAVGTESFSVDKVWIVNQDESAGLLQASNASVDGLASVSARDEFNQSAGALTGKTAPVGGVWAGAGDTDDFTVETTGHTAQRTAVSDSAITNGRFVTLLVGLGAVVVSGDVSWTSTLPSGTSRYGVLARYVNTTNYLFAGFTGSATGTAQTTLVKVVAGVATELVPPTSAYTGSGWNVQVTVGTTGVWELRVGGFVLGSGQDTDLASGGTLASGAVGIYDARTSAVAATRNYDNLTASAFATDAALFASQSAELSTSGIYREDTGGTAYGPVSVVSGDLPRIPNQSSGGTVEVFLKASRGDFETLPDPGIDDISARVYRRASWLTVS